MNLATSSPKILSQASLQKKLNLATTSLGKLSMTRPSKKLSLATSPPKKLSQGAPLIKLNIAGAAMKLSLATSTPIKISPASQQNVEPYSITGVAEDVEHGKTFGEASLATSLRKKMSLATTSQHMLERAAEHVPKGRGANPLQIPGAPQPPNIVGWSRGRSCSQP